MINVNELRIGNWVKYKSNSVKIDDISFVINKKVYGVYRGVVPTATNNEIEPIELNEKILTNSSFEKKAGDWFELNNNFNKSNSFGIFLGNNTFRVLYTTNIELQREYLVQVTYVHQLQNLYFALIGEELDIRM